MFGLYLLDICVSNLLLNKETYTDTAGSTLVTKVTFLNFPAFKIKERDRSINGNIYVFEFNSGQSYHFSISSEELVKKMKRIPLNIGVYKIDDIYPICSTLTHLTGCACDLGTQMIKDPSPFTFKGPFDLFDPGNSFSGQLNIEITITNFGRCRMSHYGLGQDCFHFKNNFEGPEYICAVNKSPAANGTFVSSGDNVILDSVPLGSLIKDIFVIAPITNHLVLGRPPPPPPREPLVDPSLPTKRNGGKQKGKK